MGFLRNTFLRFVSYWKLPNYICTEETGKTECLQVLYLLPDLYGKPDCKNIAVLFIRTTSWFQSHISVSIGYHKESPVET